MKDYIVEIKVKNGPLLSAMRRAGIWTAAELSRATGINQMQIGYYLNLSRAPIHKNGRWSPPALNLAEFFRVLPEDLFPAQHLKKALPDNRAEMEMSLDEMLALPSSALKQLGPATPEESAIAAETAAALATALGVLTPREQAVLRLRFGFDGDIKTLDEVAAEVAEPGRSPVNRERIRQIEANALRKLKHPAFPGHQKLKYLLGP